MWKTQTGLKYFTIPLLSRRLSFVNNFLVFKWSPCPSEKQKTSNEYKLDGMCSVVPASRRSHSQLHKLTWKLDNADCCNCPFDILPLYHNMSLIIMLTD